MDHHHVPKGEIRIYGSFSNGFKTGGSDLDTAFLSDGIHNEGQLKGVLQTVASLAQKFDFTNVTRIFSANVPILKFSQHVTDGSEGIEVDFCINNRLAVRNSDLLQCYGQCDHRVRELSRLVKAWAKKKQLVGTADGYLNSYAYMLMVIFFLQVGTNPPVLPNLQDHRLCPDEVLTPDDKWGKAEWDTRFYDQELPRMDEQGYVGGANKSSVGELLIEFFHFYKAKPEGYQGPRGFDWALDTVCMRRADAFKGRIDKHELMASTAHITNSNPPPQGSDSLKNLW